jgi:hypothetical protein
VSGRLQSATPGLQVLEGTATCVGARLAPSGAILGEER